jgi:hypothetical protein
MTLTFEFVWELSLFVVVMYRASSPARFMERHRAVINAYLQKKPTLLEGPFSFLLATPRLIDFANKTTFFRHQVKELKARERAAPVTLTVHRAQAFEESFRQLKGKTAAEMRGKLHVKFHGEEGIDMGGVSREWYEVLAKAICDPNLALFTSQPDRAQTYQPSKNAVIQNESMVSFRDYFRFCGRFVGKALIDGQQLSCYFTRSFYKHLLAVPLSLKDLEDVDPDYYKSLMYILDHDVDEVCPETTFVKEFDFFGRKDLVELKPGGAHIIVRCLSKHISCVNLYYSGYLRLRTLEFEVACNRVMCVLVYACTCDLCW